MGIKRISMKKWVIEHKTAVMTDIVPSPQTPHFFHLQAAQLKTIFSATLMTVTGIHLSTNLRKMGIIVIPELKIGRNISQTDRNLPRFFSVCVSVMLFGAEGASSSITYAYPELV